MAITDYTTLTQAVLDMTHRDDLRPYVDLFIQGAQEAIENDLFDLNYGNGVRFMEEVFAATPISADGSLPVPSDWLSPKFLTVDAVDGQYTLVFKAAAWIYDQYPIRQPSGIPAYIARDVDSNGNPAFVFGPFPDDAYSVQGTYYASAPVLSGANATNWLVTDFALGLHSAVMVEAAKFLVDDSMLQRWNTVYQQRLKSLVDADKAERWASSTMQIECG